VNAENAPAVAPVASTFNKRNLLAFGFTYSRIALIVLRFLIRETSDDLPKRCKRQPRRRFKVVRDLLPAPFAELLVQHLAGKISGGVAIQYWWGNNVVFVPSAA